jgi:hypothetical protein
MPRGWFRSGRRGTYDSEGLRGASELTTEQQFWRNWGTNVAVAVATFLAVIVALFGDWIRMLVRVGVPISPYTCKGLGGPQVSPRS